ncbi:DUF871 domain-containing protein [Domibacillus tundrae]|uniref:DUF871 domain-containing protein n=1 Tax=Domibacillus tundrae TaxID=1587527 RepID=UPI00061832C0|nr:MupG family TIM beta-alpha barrel fold protein [Domibacillus tundrae]
MFGVSVYLNKEIGKEEQDYLEKAKRNGFQSVFTSLHIPEDDASRLRSRFQSLARMSEKLGLALVADVSSSSLHVIGSSFERAEELIEWGVTGLRMDDGIAPDQIARLSHIMKVALNASTLRQEEWDELIQHGINVSNVEAWHNFYPRPETGLGIDYMKAKNEWLRSLGLTVMAFVPGDSRKRGPLFDGLPTLEKHRQASPFVCALELTNHLHVQKVFVGDPHLSNEGLRQFSFYNEGCIPLRAAAYTDISHYRNVQTNRPDPARDCIRSSESRRMSGAPPEPFHTIARKKGTVTVDNQHYLRYAGELQITLRDLPADEKVNVIGRVTEEDLPLLTYVGPRQSFLIDWDV